MLQHLLEAARAAQRYRQPGPCPGTTWLSHQRLGYKYRTSDLQVAPGQAQFGRIDDILSHRARVARCGTPIACTTTTG